MGLINGLAEPHLFSGDRGLHFGDGCFTTARIDQGQVVYLTDHLQRLHNDCQRLAIPFQYWSELADEMQQLAAPKTRAVLKVIITRGAGGRGYCVEGCGQPTRILATSAYPEHYRQWQLSGVRLATSPIKLGLNPALAGVKHLNRLEQVLIRQHLPASQADEALVVDYQNHIVECCAANILWCQGRRLFSPRLDRAGVEGTMKRRVIESLVEHGYAYTEVRQPVACLQKADEIIICNALMPVLPVVSVDNWRYQAGNMFKTLYQLGFTAD